jgi:hypothetical protein
MSAYSDGWSAGYRGLASDDNPYRKGMGGLLPPDVEVAANLWENGWRDGDGQAKDDLHERRAEFARGLMGGGRTRVRGEGW